MLMVLSIEKLLHNYLTEVNAEVERKNRTLLKAIRIIILKKADWKKEFNNFLTAYRSTPHSVTNISPAELIYGRKLDTNLPELSLNSNVCFDELRINDSLRKKRVRKCSSYEKDTLMIK